MTDTLSWVCDALWEDVIVTSHLEICSSRNIAGLIAYIVKDPQISADIKSLGLCTLQMIVRCNHPEDRQSAEELSSVIEVSANEVSQERANAALSSVFSDLNHFLSMYEDETESDTEISEESEKTIHEFECVLCRNGPSTDKDMFPCLLCFMDNNAAWSIHRIAC